MSEVKDRELLACPFCGCEKIEVDTEPDSEGWCYLWCSACLVAYSIHEPRRDTIKRWNTRANPIPQPDSKDMREMLLRFTQALSCPWSDKTIHEAIDRFLEQEQK